MTNLMCRGRKRGLAGVIATQRLAKLAKNVAAEASNFLMGRTFLDIDMIRAADLLGMERRQAEQIRDLERGQFLALGPALSRRPELLRIGKVQSEVRGVPSVATPLPTLSDDQRQALLVRAAAPALTPMPTAPPVPAHIAPGETPEDVDHLLSRLDEASPEPAPPEQADMLGLLDAAALADQVLADIVGDSETGGRPAGALYQDFTLRCRMRGAIRPPLDLAGFSRALALARAGVFSDASADPDMALALQAASDAPEDMLGVFMLLARAAQAQAPCPPESEIADVYGTASLGRVRRMLGYMESRGLIAITTDFRGRRSATIPRLGWTTAPEEGAGTATDPLMRTVGQE